MSAVDAAAASGKTGVVDASAANSASTAEACAAAAAAVGEAPPAARVRGIAGQAVAEVSPVPATIGALKAALEEVTGCPQACQRLLTAGGAARLLGDGDALDPEGVDLLVVVDESPMATWDVRSNPARDVLLAEDGGHIRCPALRTDYVNVLTQEPLRHGVHYFEFVMHRIGDEQWCGLVQDRSLAGSRVSGRHLEAWAYYAGRMRSRHDSLRDGHGALHAKRMAVTGFQTLRPNGDLIGMLVDLGVGALAFDLNGVLQGACPIPQGVPLWVFTHLDTPDDYVELRKPPVQDAPPESLAALSGALLDISQGVRLSYFDHRESESEAEEDIDVAIYCGTDLF